MRVTMSSKGYVRDCSYAANIRHWKNVQRLHAVFFNWTIANWVASKDKVFCQRSLLSIQESIQDVLYFISKELGFNASVIC